MPCGGGDIGLNVWVEKGDVLFYIARSGNYDENNALLKSGRVRIHFDQQPFDNGTFKQILNLNNGCVEIVGIKDKLTTHVKIWVDVFKPQIHVEINSSRPLTAEATYESWRYHDLLKTGIENNENGYKSFAQNPVRSYHDSIAFENNRVLFIHQNKHQPDIFDATIKQQGLDAVKDRMFNPVKNLVFGGSVTGTHMKSAVVVSGNYINTTYKGWKLSDEAPTRSHHITITLFTQQTPLLSQWCKGLALAEKVTSYTLSRQNTVNWWHQFWQRSFIYINSDRQTDAWQAGRNYQLFRYMLGSNVSGSYPTKFNGGLFTYDPSLVNPAFTYTPDFRNWGGSIFTAQNQRLVYFPMLKSGDYDVLKPQLDFYLRILKNAQLATRHYWKHGGARFTEQIENFGLSDIAEYGNNRPANFDPGVDYNPWLEYHWETVLEFCLMMLETKDYNNSNIKPYIPFIENCLDFFDEHYQYLALQREGKALDGQGHLILYPGSAAETFKMANNSTSTIAGLRTITEKMLQLQDNYASKTLRIKLNGILNRLPPLNFQTLNGHQTIAPAKSWERVNNEESPQLYPVFPWGIYGIGKPGLNIALNTWHYDTLAIKFRSHIGWKQDNIFAARLGLTDEAQRLTFLKLKNSGRKFPAFWGPGFDWAPDHNWGGSGMIGLQEMLLQAVDDKIYLFPAWPADLNVHFKLHAPKQTIIECSLKNGHIEWLKVLPESRLKDVVNCLQTPVK